MAIREREVIEVVSCPNCGKTLTDTFNGFTKYTRSADDPSEVELEWWYRCSGCSHEFPE